MNIDACPVAELGRLMYVQFDALADAGRDDDEDARKAAHSWVSALCLAQTTVQATSWRGVMLQLNEHRAIDDDLFSDPDIAAAIEKAGRGAAVQTKKRLIGLVQRAVATLAPESRIARDAEGRPA
ncbi:MAG: hypothetical protein WCF81_07215 [Roseiarcus sp.]